MKWVYCTVIKEGYHKWEGAKAYPEVSYLADKHRHLFHYKISVSVEGNDREIEFIMLKHKMEKFISSAFSVDDMGSCESQAERIVEELKVMYPHRDYKVQVSEDGENGSIVESE